MKNKCVQSQVGRDHDGAANISVILTCRAFCSYSKLLIAPLCRDETGDYYHESQDGASNLQTVGRLNENYPSGSTEG